MTSTDTDFSLTDREVEAGYQVTWLNRSTLAVNLENGYLKLRDPYDPTNTGGLELPAGSEFNWFEISAMYQSDSRNMFTYVMDARYGGALNPLPITPDNAFPPILKAYSDIISPDSSFDPAKATPIKSVIASRADLNASGGMLAIGVSLIKWASFSVIKYYSPYNLIKRRL